MCCGMHASASGSAEPPELPAEQRILRIAADPNNLPFSNRAGEGFENKIAELIAHELSARIEYVWRAQRRGFFRETLKEGTCDLVLGVPAKFEMALTTVPYYRSTYAFVVPEESSLKLESLDDPALRTLRIGVHLIGDDGINTPPAHALAERNIITNLVGFSIYGDYAQPNPPRRIIEAVAKKEIDLAVIWGPLAGYFASRTNSGVRVIPLKTKAHPKDLPFAFDIAIGVRKKDTALRDELNEILLRKRQEIQRILAEYGVPLEAQTDNSNP